MKNKESQNFRSRVLSPSKESKIHRQIIDVKERTGTDWNYNRIWLHGQNIYDDKYKIYFMNSGLVTPMLDICKGTSMAWDAVYRKRINVSLVLIWYLLSSMAVTYRWTYSVFSDIFRVITLEKVNTVLKKQNIKISREISKCDYSEIQLWEFTLNCDWFIVEWKLSWVNSAIVNCKGIHPNLLWWLNIETGICFPWKWSPVPITENQG